MVKMCFKCTAGKLIFISSDGIDVHGRNYRCGIRKLTLWHSNLCEPVCNSRSGRYINNLKKKTYSETDKNQNIIEFKLCLLGNGSWRPGCEWARPLLVDVLCHLAEAFPVALPLQHTVCEHFLRLDGRLLQQLTALSHVWPLADWGRSLSMQSED